MDLSLTLLDRKARSSMHGKVKKIKIDPMIKVQTTLGSDNNFHLIFHPPSPVRVNKRRQLIQTKPRIFSSEMAGEIKITRDGEFIFISEIVTFQNGNIFTSTP